MKPAADRAAAGAAWLDEKMPLWWKHVVVKDLDLSSTCRCVLGQIFGVEDEDLENHDGPTGYFRGLNTLRIGERQSKALGFDSLDDLDCAVEEYEYETLTEAWKREIRQRRTAARTRKLVNA